MSSAPTTGQPVSPKALQPTGQPRRIKIDIPEDGFTSIRDPRKKYWIGTIKACPYQNIDCGGHSFPRFVEDAEFGDGETIRTKRKGAFVFLDDTDLKRVCDAVANKMLRFMGPERPDGSRRGQILSRSGQVGRPYRPLKGDEPLGRYLYMIEVPADSEYVSLPKTPQTMVD